MLVEIDRYADAHGFTRSGFLAKAAERAMEREETQADIRRTGLLQRLEQMISREDQQDSDVSRATEVAEAVEIAKEQARKIYAAEVQMPARLGRAKKGAKGNIPGKRRSAKPADSPA